MSKRIHRSLAILAAAGAVFTGSVAKATFHEWRYDEIYSNPSGTVQFIEMQLPSSGIDDESFVGGKTITDSANGNTFTFPTNTPSVPVVNQHLLIATPGYAALSGVPTADYILPSNDFFNVSGDTLTYVGGIDLLTFTSAQLDADGTHSLVRTTFGGSTFATAVNSPTNFAGATGSVTVPEPATATLAAGGLLILATRRNRRRAGVSIA